MSTLASFQSSQTPAKAYEVGVKFATLLRHLFNHPEFRYLEPPTATIMKMDPERTPKALFFVTDFIQNTYVNNVLPFLPAGVTRKCKALANPWAYADESYQWEWTWDSYAGEMKNATGEVVAFPKLPASKAKENATDMFARNFIVKKLVMENSSDPKAQSLLGGAFDFGDDVKSVMASLG